MLRAKLQIHFRDIPKILMPKDFFLSFESHSNLSFLILVIAKKTLRKNLELLLLLLDDYYNYYSTADDSIFFKKRKNKANTKKKIFKQATTK